MAKSQAPSTQTLGHYALRQKLGEGAMGQVWLAHDKFLDRDVAIKIMHAGAGDKRQVQEFLREAQSAAKLNHPNTVIIYEIGKQGDQVFIAMEYIEAGSLSDELRDTGALPWREATQAIRDAAAGLQAAHERGMIHRDIKPSNLMRSARGLIKVVDFGLAKSRTIDGQVTQTVAGTILGSPAYMSPEQCRGEPADARSDLYSLTCSYYHLLTRQTPFDASELTAAMYKHCHEPFPDGRASGFEVPDGVVRILERGSQKDPADRYQTAADLIADLDTVLHTPEVSHTFERQKAAAKSKPLPKPKSKPAPKPKPAARIGGSSIGSILRGRGVLGKTAWVLAIALAAGAIAVWQSKRATSKAEGLAQAPGTLDSSIAGAHGTATVTQSVPPATGRVVDLISLIDAGRDRLTGRWKRVDQTLGGVEQSVIQVPYHPPAEYDFRVVFSPGNDAGHGLNLILSKGNRMFAFTLGTQYFCDAFSNVRGRDGDATQNPTRVTSKVRPSLGQRYTVEVRVRNDRVEALVGGTRVTSYKTDYSDLSIPKDFERVQPGTLGLATCDAPATIYSAEAIEVSGSGAVDGGHRVVESTPVVHTPIPTPTLAPRPTPVAISASPRTVNVLKLIDINRDQLSGSWKEVDGALTSVGTKAVIQIPYHPPTEYDFNVVFSPGDDKGHGINLILSKGSRMFHFVLSASNYWDAFSHVNGQNGDKPENPTSVPSAVRPIQGQKYTIQVRVRNDHVEALLGGKPVTHYKTDYSDLTTSADFANVQPGTMGLSAFDAPATIYSAEVVEIPGSRPVGDAHRVIDLMPMIRIDHDAITGVWRRDGSTLVSDGSATKNARLRLPYVPPPEYDFKIEFTCVDGTELRQLLRQEERRFDWVMGSHGNRILGFERVDNLSSDKNPSTIVSEETIKPGVRYTSTVRVRKGMASGSVGGKTVECKNDGEHLSQESWSAIGGHELGLATYINQVVFHKIEVTEISEAGVVLAHANDDSHLRRILPLGGAPATGVQFSPDGRRIFARAVPSYDASGAEKIACVWDVRDGTVLQTMDNNMGSLMDDAGDRLFVGQGSTPLVERISDSVALCKFKNWAGPSPISVNLINADGTRVILAGRDGMVRVWDVDKDAPVREFRAAIHQVARMLLSPDGRRLLTRTQGEGNGDKRVTLWDLSNGRELWHNDLPNTAGVTQFTGGNGLMVVGENSTNVYILDAMNGTLLHTLTHHATVKYAAASQDGTMVVGCTNVGLALWDLKSGNERAAFATDIGPINKVAISRAGTHVLAGCEDGTVRLFELPSGKQLCSYTGHDKGVISVAFSPDEKTAASGSNDRTVRLWKLPE